MYLAPIRASFLLFGLRGVQISTKQWGLRRERLVKWNHLSDEKCWLFCVFNVYMYFTALHEKCDTTGQMRDIRLPTVNVLLVLWKWWVVVREKMDFCAP